MKYAKITEIIKDAKNGRMFILVDDEQRENEGDLIVPASKVNSKLINQWIRGFVSINIQTSEVFDTHSFAVLLGVGATTINSYLAFDSIHQRYEKKLFGKLNFEECIHNYIKSIDNGLLKIILSI